MHLKFECIIIKYNFSHSLILGAVYGLELHVTSILIIHIYMYIYDINCMHIHATAFVPQFPVYQLIVSYGQTVIVSNNKC